MVLPTISAEEQADSFEEQLATLIARQPRRMLVSLLVSVLLIAGLAWRTTPWQWVVVWLAFAGAVIVLRLIVQGPTRLMHLPARKRLRIAVVLVALSGIAHGSSLVFFIYMSPVEQVVLSMMLVGLCAGAVATGAGYPPMFAAYLGPTLCPLAIMWAANSSLSVLGWLQPLMAILIVLFSFVLIGLARDTYRIVRESYEIRLERVALNRELRNALDAAEAANRAKTRFLASASHDLRQPMQTLSLFAAALAMRPLDEKSRGIAENLNTALQDLTGELDALLDVSKLDAGIVKPDPAPFALAPLLERIESTFALAAKDKGLQLFVRCSRDIWLLTDRKLFERVLRNLVENAIKYTDTGSITVAAMRDVEQERVRVTVADTGCGIAPSEHERVFEEFYQIDNPGRDRARGLGLGLSIVRRLADLLGLEVTMISAPGEGTRFTIASRTIAVSDSPASLRTQPIAVDAQIRVLLIDDEESVRRGMHALLEEHGCTVALANGTEQALTLCPAADVDLLIADFRLRDGDDGISAIRKLRDIRPQLPALLLTGETAPDRLKEAHEAGIPVLHKPVSPQLLMQEIAKASAIKRKTAHGERGASTGRGTEL